ncbi:hypothetical protein CMO96_01445 [Candidatus Woesebacteria bacterium]|nr:hypothetical protein [Candidatus Woesebacteria bacterium]
MKTGFFILQTKNTSFRLVPFREYRSRSSTIGKGDAFVGSDRVAVLKMLISEMNVWVRCLGLTGG